MTNALGILCYHRLVADDEVADAWPYLERGTAVRMTSFRAHLEELAAFADVLSEHEALDALAGRRSLRRPAVWLTFDDGYRDVLRITPLATGTAFITTCTPTAALPADAWYSVLLGARQRSGAIDLGMGPFAYDLQTVEGRSRLVNGPERRRYLRGSREAQSAALQALSSQLDAVPRAPVPYLSSADLQALLGAGWTVGSHGATHTPFDGLEATAAVEEAVQSRAALTARGVTVRSLALPDGSRPLEPAAVLAAGYECVLGLGSDIATPGAVVQPRFVVPDDPSWVRTTLRARLA
jgi:peptidoglycan/xylan/chitin deacetylase (PgdA/CDA1 family)